MWITGIVSIAASVGRGRLAAGRRRGVVVRALEALAVEALADEARGAVRRGAVRRVVARRALAVAFFVVRLAARFTVVVVRRRVVAARVPVPRAICLACLVRPSMRLRTLFTSARVLALFTCA
ncbi:MAG: hypothetical protein E6J20_07300 [Chloroflexi bacterium]|nr:MAG: hypothetical protein E6J20_07300 [Chloroflexota bacterium]